VRSVGPGQLFSALRRRRPADPALGSTDAGETNTRTGPEIQPSEIMCLDVWNGLEDTQFSVAGFGIMGYHIFRKRQYALLPFEFDPVGGIGRELNFARFCPKPGYYISKRFSSLKLRQQ
jgi:hypothetical protein